MIKNNTLKITVLGCGASNGVPVVGCSCAVCTSPDPKNKRLRVSLLIETPQARILVDTSPDMRQQCLANKLTSVDAIIFTHAHADHLHGIDDLRTINAGKGGPIEAYGEAATLQSIRDRFGYVFMEPKPAPIGWYRPCLMPHVIEPHKPFLINGLEVRPFAQKHGGGTSLGFRIGNFAYSTDTNGLSAEAFVALEGVDTWIVDCLRYLPAPTHAHLDMALEWIAQVKPRRAYLTHMNHEFDYDGLSAQIPAGVEPAYDGLTLEIAG